VRRSSVPFVLSLVILFGGFEAAHAGPLAPGQTRGGDAFRLDLNDPSFAGQTLATRTITQDVTDVDTVTGEMIGVSITLTHLVVRETATGNLAFHYRIAGTQDNATVDFENLDVTAFAGFTTDVFSDETSLTDAGSRRSADGNTIGFIGDESWGAAFVIRTNATGFEEDGTAVVWASFQTGDPAGGTQRFPSFDTFRPTADGGPGPTPIPLPPPAWAGLATAGLFGTLRRLRRRRRS
jgi:hypothetical protein